MKRTTKYVALDVHQDTTVASVREAGGRVLARAVLPTEESAITKFFEGMRGAVHVAFEEGTQAQWLHEVLSPRVDRVVVCDSRGQARHGNKGDVSDADELSELMRCGRLRSVYHGSPHRATLKALARTYQNLVGDCTRVMQRIKAVFRARGIKTSGSSVYHPGRQPGLIAKGGNVQQSAGSKYVLDNRSHRTLYGSKRAKFFGRTPAMFTEIALSMVYTCL